MRYFFPWTHLTVAPVAKHVFFSSSQPKNLAVRQRNSCVAIQLVTSLRPRIKLFGHTVKKDTTLSKHCPFLVQFAKKRRPNKKNIFPSFNAVHFRHKVLRRLHNTILFFFWETGIAFTAQKRNLVFFPLSFPSRPCISSCSSPQ